MAQHVVLILNQTVPQIQEPQVGDSYLMIRDVEIQGSLTISGTVDGRDIAADGAVLDTALQPGDNISTLVNDSGYTDDQTGAEIKAALFAEVDTNNYNDAAVAKLAGIAAGAEVNPLFASQAEAQAGTENTKIMTALRVAQAIAVFSSGLLNKYDGTQAPLATNDVNDGYSVGSIWMDQTPNPPEVYRCVDNSPSTAVWVKTSLTIDELSTVALSGDSDDLIEGVSQLLMTAAERSKLTGIEAGATADQSGAEIKALYEAEADTNAFTDAEKTKLAGLGGAPGYVAKTGAYNVAVTDGTVDCTANSFALTLLDAVATPYRVHHLKNSGSGVITINTTSGQTIDGQASGAITLAQYENLTVQSNGANWIIL